ncbi:MAG: T9SS type A sorting domain-containing protein [Bacteroidetes bacterium]|nr:T9SS type A sorting domain-containing protein [Bacteroidota bacterium]
MKIKFIPFLLLTVLPLILPAQDITPSRGKVFDDEVVSRVDVFIDPADLNEVLDPNNTIEYPATFVFTRYNEPDTLFNVGFRLRGNTSLFADKKSFKVSFNTFIFDQDYKDLEKLNLNGEHNDPSVTRSKICWDLLRDMELAGSRANHVELYINGDYFGLYANTEHIDEEFVDLRFGNKEGNLYKCSYPADLNYLGSDPDLYKLEANGVRVYELKTNESEDDYSDLANFIDVLNNTSDADFACEIEKIFNVDAYLQFMVFDILTGNWDGPLFNKNNFYLYHNTATDKFEYIPYDLDNTLGIDWLDEDWGTYDIYDWTPNEARPLYDRFMENETFRSQFSFYMERLIDDEFNLPKLEDNLDETRDLIGPYVEDDPYYPLDYGFDFQQFQDSFEEELPYFQTPYGIKPYIETRANSALNQLENIDLTPIVFEVSNNFPDASQDVRIRAKALSDSDLTFVECCYSVNGGGEVCEEMFDDGAHGDLESGDGIYGIIIPALEESAEIEYKVQATDMEGQEGVRPYCGSYLMTVTEPIAPLYINELMASNDLTIQDEFGEYDDWLELYHDGDELLFIGGYFLTDDPTEPNKWSLPDVFMEPGEFLILWIDDDDGTQGDHHASFKLSADGETVGLYDAGLNLVDEVSFPNLGGDEAFGRIPNGTGPFDFVVPTPGASNVALSSTLEKEVLQSINLYPNPTDAAVLIDMESYQDQLSDLKIFNTMGQLLFHQDWTDNPQEKVELQLDLPPGIYQVFLQGAKAKRYTAKLVIQR